MYSLNCKWTLCNVYSFCACLYSFKSILEIVVFLHQKQLQSGYGYSLESTLKTTVFKKNAGSHNANRIKIIKIVNALRSFNRTPFGIYIVYMYVHGGYSCKHLFGCSCLCSSCRRCHESVLPFSRQYIHVVEWICCECR